MNNVNANTTPNLSAREARALTLASSTTSYLDTAVEEDLQHALLQIRHAAEQGLAQIVVPLRLSPGGAVMIRLAALGYMVQYREDARLVANERTYPWLPVTELYIHREVCISWYDDVTAAESAPAAAAEPVEPAP